jgi:hypothetical protein
VLSFIMGSLYAGFVGLISVSLMGPLISWPIWIGLFLLAFAKFNLLRFTGFIGVLPVSPARIRGRAFVEVPRHVRRHVQES